MAKRLQVQGPLVRSEQTKVIAPMVDTYYREEALDPTQLKAVRLAEFVSDITAKGQDLAVKIDKEKTDKGLMELADYAWGKGDKVTFDAVADELGIVKNDKTFYAFNQLKGDRQGQALANKLQDFYINNKARFMDNPDSTLMQKEIQDHLKGLIEGAVKGEEGSFGFKAALIGRVQGRSNQLSQTFMSEFGAVRADEQKEAAAVAFGTALDSGDLDTLNATSKQQQATGLLSRSQVKEGILSAAYAKIALDPENAQAIADLVRQVPTAGGSKLGDIPEVGQKLDDAVKKALAAQEKELLDALASEKLAQTQEQNRLMEKYSRKDISDPFRPIPDSEYKDKKDIWGSVHEFNHFRRLREAENDSQVMLSVRSLENFQMLHNALRNAGTRAEADTMYEKLKANARNVTEEGLIDSIARGIFTEGPVPLYEEPEFQEANRLLQRKYQFNNDIGYQKLPPSKRISYDEEFMELQEEYYRLSALYSGEELHQKVAEYINPLLEKEIPSTVELHMGVVPDSGTGNGGTGNGGTDDWYKIGGGSGAPNTEIIALEEQGRTYTVTVIKE